MFVHVCVWMYNKSYIIFFSDNVEHVGLSKGSSGLGFSVIGGAGAYPRPLQCVPRVRKVFSIGPATDSGKVNVGDVILEVNGVKLKGKSHNVSLLCARH